MRADQESTRRFHQRRSSAVETPTVLRLLASGFGFRPHSSLECNGERSFNPPESPRFRVEAGLSHANMIIARSFVTIIALDSDRFRAIALED